jgi:hypothetical protein
MSLDIKKVEYFNVTVDGNAGEGANLLSAFASADVNLLAFKAFALESGRIRFSLFPNDSSKMIAGAKQAGLELDGPHAAVLIQGDEDESGALADIFEKLSQANIHVKEASGFADIKASYGVVLYLDPEDCKKALAALK